MIMPKICKLSSWSYLDVFLRNLQGISLVITQRFVFINRYLVLRPIASSTSRHFLDCFINCFKCFSKELAEKVIGIPPSICLRWHLKSWNLLHILEGFFMHSLLKSVSSHTRNSIGEYIFLGITLIVFLFLVKLVQLFFGYF